MRLVLTAFEAKPTAGTEAGLAWNWSRAYQSLGHDVQVVTQASALTVGDRRRWDAAGIPVVGLGSSEYTVAPHGPAEMLRNFRRYSRWLASVNTWLAQHPAADAVQHLSLSSARLPWPRPTASSALVLGPVGGAHLPPARGLKTRDLPGEALRALSVPVLGAVRRQDVRRGGGPAVLLSTNRQTTDFARRAGVRAVSELLTDGVPESLVVERPRALSAPPQLLWAGRMVSTKRPDLALLVLERLLAAGVDARLTMAGDGPQLPILRSLAAERGLRERITFSGKLAWPELLARYDRADLYLFTSMRDSSCPAVVEAAARGVPTVAVRHQGVGTLVPVEVAPGPTSVRSTEQLVVELTATAAWLLEDADAYVRASAACLTFARTQTWSCKAERVLALLRGRAA